VAVRHQHELALMVFESASAAIFIREWESAISREVEVFDVIGDARIRARGNLHYVLVASAIDIDCMRWKLKRVCL